MHAEARARLLPREQRRNKQSRRRRSGQVAIALLDPFGLLMRLAPERVGFNGFRSIGEAPRPRDVCAGKRGCVITGIWGVFVGG